MQTHLKENLHLSHPKYRPDIDGLRAIAVLSVVAFHVFPVSIRGGFIGVDVFFVISGFLISTIIFENLDRGTFNFYEFYARRIKRIFPALLLVFLATYILGWFTLLADEYKQLGRHISAGTAFLSNFLLWSEAGYFDNLAETKPLLHLWSLGIEEQFYIVWPFILWFTWKQRLNLLTLTIVLALVSFFLNVKGVNKDEIAAFYSPQTRFWELLSGSVLAWLALYNRDWFFFYRLRIDGWIAKAVYRERVETNGILLNNSTSIFGFLFLVYGFLKITKDVSFPGNWALFPVLGTVLVISAGPKAWVNRCILSNKILIWFGVISFPLYLWHWPLLSFARIIEGETPGFGVRIAIVSLSVLLAWLTYKLVECPLRFGHYNKVKVVGLVTIMAIFGGIGYMTYDRNGLTFRLEDRESFNAYFENSLPEWKFDTEHDISTVYRADCNFYNLEAYRFGRATKIPLPKINPSCYTVDKSKSYRVLLWGDSHAQQLYYGLSNNLPNNWQVLLGISSGCIPAVVENNSYVDYCIRSNFHALSTIKHTKPDVVVIAQNSGHDVSNSLGIYTKLKELGVQRIIFIGPVPHWKSDLPKIIARQLWVNTPQRTFVGVDKDLILINRGLKQQWSAHGLQFLDLMSLFCNEDGCLTRIGDDRLTGITTQDYGHLLPIASDFVAKNLLVQKIVEN